MEGNDHSLDHERENLGRNPDSDNNDPPVIYHDIAAGIIEGNVQYDQGYTQHERERKVSMILFTTLATYSHDLMVSLVSKLIHVRVAAVP